MKIIPILLLAALSFGFTWNDRDKDMTPGSGSPESQKVYFDIWHGTEYGHMLPYEYVKEMERQVMDMPSESQRSVNSWTIKGPYGMSRIGSEGKFSGRILDIELDATTAPRIAAASGGVWTLGFLNIPVCLTDNLPTVVTSTFDTKPGDNNTMIVGTGEPGIETGLGAYKTTNGGNTWISLTFPDNQGEFYKIRYSPNNSNIVHAATTKGHYRSTNGGDTWTKTLTGNISDFVFFGNAQAIMYAARDGVGLYRSVDGGGSWGRLNGAGLPADNLMGRTALATTPANANLLVTSMALDSNNRTLGVFKSTNLGTTWTTITPNPEFLSDQGWYDNVVSICPTNANIMFAGGIRLWKTTNGGSSWVQIDDSNIHADQHNITWGSTPGTVYVGNDGGQCVSTDYGVTWSTTTNRYPITQYVNIDVSRTNNNYIYGGSQDNGISGTTNGGLTWNYVKVGDGGGISIEPGSPQNVYVTAGAYSGTWAFKRFKTTNNGVSFSTEINTGVDASTQWYTQMRNDQSTTAMHLFHNSGHYVYRSTNKGQLWVKLNTTPFGINTAMTNITVTKFTAPHAIVYACLANVTTGQVLRVFENNIWSERSTGLPSNQSLRTVSPHPKTINIAYALFNGSNAGKKVYKTTNKGVSWFNISGNLPNVPMGDLIAHPTDSNKLYLGTYSGCFRTTNAGVNWHKWNNGMPGGNFVTEMNYIDSTNINGKFYIVAGTYGRGIWEREISGDDPFVISSTGHNSTEIPEVFALEQNYPNPFNPITTIKFSLPIDVNVKIEVFDITGRLVDTPINGFKNAGYHEVSFDGSKLSSGIYFYRINTESFSDIKRMMLVK